jgi:hypothetical protein
VYIQALYYLCMSESVNTYTRIFAQPCPHSPVPAQDQPEVLVEADEEDEEEEDDDSADDERIMGSMLQTIVDHSVVTVARVRLGEDPDEIVDDSVLEERGDFRLAAPAEDGEGEEQLAVVEDTIRRARTSSSESMVF